MKQGLLRTAALGHRDTLRWTAWMTPIAAVAAVTAAIGSTSHPIGVYERGLSATAQAGATGVPKSYVDLGPVAASSAGGPFKEAMVVNTVTGKATATVDPPKPYVGFDFVAAAGNSSTFVLAAQQPFSAHLPEAFFRLNVSQTGHAQLRPLSLPVTTFPGFLMGIALSPNGQQLALASNGSPPWTQGSLLQVVNLANGTSRQWTWPNVDSEWDFSSTLAGLAWTNNQTVAFLLPVGKRPTGSPELSSGVTQARVLHTAAVGTNLAASTRAPGKASYGGGDTDMAVAPGASLIMEFDRALKAPAPKGIDEVSTATGKTVRIIGGGKAVEAFWSNATGTQVVVREENAPGQFRLGIATAKGTFTALPTPPGVTAKDWQNLFTAW